MTFFFPEDKISEIKRAIDIVDIVSEVVLLKKAGKNFVGLCPFHSEKTPSFTVSHDKQMFRCFGCGEGGDVFNFIMRYSNISFYDALIMMAKKYGIELPERDNQLYKEKFSERENLFAINYHAMDFFSQNLFSENGRTSLQYLLKRGLSNEIISEFKLGYAPNKWDGFLNYLTNRKISLDSAITLGLLIEKKEKNGFYDRFRNRVIFPIFDTNGQPIGFGGRVLDDSLPKYLNSPESLIYKKSRSLYGLFKTKTYCREQKSIYIVEGYLDFLSLYQHGIKNAAATLGTALTAEHIRTLIKGYADKVNLVYDSDEAGINASLRSVAIFLKEKVEARIVVLPKGYDPDSYLLEFGAQPFKKIAEKGVTLISFLINSAIKKHGLSTEGKIRIISELHDSISSIDDNFIRSLFVKELAESIDIKESIIFEKINKTTSYNIVSKENNIFQNKISSTIQIKATKLEKQIVSMMLQFPDILPEIEKRGVIEYFEDENLKIIGKWLIDSKKNNSFNLMETLPLPVDNYEKNRIIALLSMKDESWDYNGFLKLISQFEYFCQRNKKTVLLKEIKAAEDINDKKILEELLRRKQDMARKSIT